MNEMCDIFKCFVSFLFVTCFGWRKRREGERAVVEEEVEEEEEEEGGRRRREVGGGLFGCNYD